MPFRELSVRLRGLRGNGLYDDRHVIFSLSHMPGCKSRRSVQIRSGSNNYTIQSEEIKHVPGQDIGMQGLWK